MVKIYNSGQTIAVTPLAPWIGGKRLLAKRLCVLIENIPHQLYAEPFVGMGGIFFRRDHRAKAEVINDINRDIVNLFRVVQRHQVPLIDMLRWQLSSRVEFDRILALNPEVMTDLERAARFLYLQKLAFGGKLEGQNYGVIYDGPARFDPSRIAGALDAVCDRLTGVQIECMGYSEFIQRYDRPNTLFYLDPPYWGNETDYGIGIFTRDDFQALAKVLRGAKGKFLLSLNDCAGVRTCFRGFDMIPIQTKYTISGGGGKTVGELIISNVPKVRELLKPNGKGE